MTPLYSLTGFVLKRRPHREADRIYTVLSREMGKVDVLARGGRRLHAKLTPHVESASLLHLFVADGRRGFTLVGTDVEELFHPRDAWAKERLALFTSSLHLADLGTRPHARERELFSHLHSWMRFCHATEPLSERRSMLLLGAFALQLVAHAGYAPELRSCLSCREPVLEGGFLWSSSRGGVVCRSCASKESPSWQSARIISEETLKLLRFALEHSFTDLTRLKLTPETFGEFHRIIDGLILAHFPLIPAMSVPAMARVDYLEVFSVE